MGLAHATSVTHTPGVRTPTSRPCTIALCPCPSHHRLRSRRHRLLAGSCSSALCGLSARGPGGSRGAGRPAGQGGGGGGGGDFSERCPTRANRKRQQGPWGASYRVTSVRLPMTPQPSDLRLQQELAREASFCHATSIREC